LQKIFTSLFLCENDFTANKYLNQAICSMSVGPLYYILGVGGPKSYKHKNWFGTPRGASLE